VYDTYCPSDDQFAVCSDSSVPLVERLVSPTSVVAETGCAETEYEVIGAPPVDDGASQVTRADASREDAATEVAAPGAAAGTTTPEGTEAAPEPTSFTAATVNVYVVPFVRPVTVHDVVAVIHVNPPGDEVTEYEVISLAPLDAGAFHATRTEESPKVPTTEVGGAGTLAKLIGVDGKEADPVPATLVAVTVNEYATPLVRPVIVQVRLLVVQVNDPGLEATE
jgi:hypothetical protein